MEICCSFKSFAGGTCGFSYREDRSFISQVVPLRSTENEVDLILSRAGIFKTPKDIDDLTICPTHRSNLGVGWSRGSNSRCRVPKELFGHGEGRVKSIPKGDRGIGKRVSRIILKVSGKFLQPGSGKYATYHRVQNYASRQT